MTVLNFCIVCQGRENLQRCGRCKSVQYCSAKCQKEDWNNHKKYCKELCGIRADLEELKDLPLCIAPYLATQKDFNSLRVKNWDEALDHLRIKLPGQAFRKYVTEELSWPLTLLAAICKHNLEGKSKLRVHVVGATERYMNQGYVTDLLEVSTHSRLSLELKCLHAFSFISHTFMSNTNISEYYDLDYETFAK